jgi:integrase
MRGHIRKRGRNSWEIKFEIERTDGQRQTRYKSFRGSKSEAAAELTRLLAQVQTGGFVDSDKLTVAEYVRARVAHWHAKGIVGSKAAERYDELVEYQLIPFLGKRLLQKLRSNDIEDWHTHLLTKGRRDGTGGVSTRTLGHVHKLLKRALRDAVRDGLVLKNVAAEVKAPKIVEPEMKILSPEQVSAMPAMLAGRTITAPALVSLFTGMRRGELLALRWLDVDLDRKEITVRRALEQSIELGTRVKEPKTKSGKRTIRLPDIVVETMREHRRQQLEQRLALGLGKPPEDALVFPAPGTERLWNPDVFSGLWKDVETELGLGISFHSLRHTHASQLIAAGVPITEIAHRLGHQSPTTTLSIYAHLFRKDDSKAAAAINVALAGAQGGNREVK